MRSNLGWRRPQRTEVLELKIYYLLQAGVSLESLGFPKESWCGSITSCSEPLIYASFVSGEQRAEVSYTFFSFILEDRVNIRAALWLLVGSCAYYGTESGNMRRIGDDECKGLARDEISSKITTIWDVQWPRSSRAIRQSSRSDCRASRCFATSHQHDRA